MPLVQMKTQKLAFLVLLSLFLPTVLFAQPSIFHDSRSKVGVSVEVSQTQVKPGSHIVLAVVLTHEEHWHTHTNDPQVPEELGDPEDYIATELVFELPEDIPLTIHEGFTQWPTPVVAEVGFAGIPVDYSVFEGVTVIYVPITINQDAPIGNISFILKPVFQSCDDTTCLRPTPRKESGPAWDEYGIPIVIEVIEPATGEVTVAPHETFRAFDRDVFAKIHAGVGSTDDDVEFDLFGYSFTLRTSSTFGFYLLLLVAMGGGFLLNLTPCVLPVIPIKIMGLSAHAGNRRRTLYLGVWMMFGVMALWVGLGAAIALISGFTAINQLFQYPAFTMILGLFIGIMAIGMGGLFSIRLPNFVHSVNPKQDSWYGSFLFGIMAAVLSTPCTAPFMGAAALWAAKQNPILTLSVFGAIGFGMALPYLVLAAFPKLVEKMPRSGAASEVVKQVMGLLMLAAAIYFIGVGLSGITLQEGAAPSRVYLWFVAGAVASAGIWLAWRTIQIAKIAMVKLLFVTLGLLIVLISLYAGFFLTNAGPIDWEYYSSELLKERLAEGDVVVIQFTAEWCLNCKALESTVLHDARVAEALDADDVSAIKVDLTGNNTAGNALLNKVGLGIPLLIVLGPDGDEVFRGDFYTVHQVLQSIEKAREQR